MTNEELIQLAIEARNNSKAIKSNYKVGCSLLTKSGKIYTGTNIEDTQYLILGICAERLAIYKAIEDGETEFEKIAVVGGSNKLEKTTPCGICRQFISEHCKNIMVVYLDDEENICEKSIKELLPEGFEPTFGEEGIK